MELIWLLEAALWQLGYRGTFVLVAIMLLSLCFTRWARVHLGRLWSGVITRNEGHKLIDTGAYAFVRHPNLYRAFYRAIGDTAVEATAPALSRGSSYELWLLAEGALRGAVSEDRTWFGVLRGLPPARAKDRPLHNPR
jgi:protein-S-isoprenylcysteine O-methyltransferase Ste14